MVTENLDQIRARIEAARTGRTAATPASSSDALAKPGEPADAFVHGARVFDVQLGLEGEIEGAPLLAKGPTAVLFVRLSDGRLMPRTREQLIARPTPPAR